MSTVSLVESEAGLGAVDKAVLAEAEASLALVQDASDVLRLLDHNPLERSINSQYGSTYGLARARADIDPILIEQDPEQRELHVQADMVADHIKDAPDGSATIAPCHKHGKTFFNAYRGFTQLAVLARQTQQDLASEIENGSAALQAWQTDAEIDVTDPGRFLQSARAAISILENIPSHDDLKLFEQLSDTQNRAILFLLESRSVSPLARRLIERSTRFIASGTSSSPTTQLQAMAKLAGGRIIQRSYSRNNEAELVDFFNLIDALKDVAPRLAHTLSSGSKAHHKGQEISSQLIDGSTSILTERLNKLSEIVQLDPISPTAVHVKNTVRGIISKRHIPGEVRTSVESWLQELSKSHNELDTAGRQNLETELAAVRRPFFASKNEVKADQDASALSRKLVNDGLGLGSGFVKEDAFVVAGFFLKLSRDLRTGSYQEVFDRLFEAAKRESELLIELDRSDYQAWLNTCCGFLVDNSGTFLAGADHLLTPVAREFRKYLEDIRRFENHEPSISVNEPETAETPEITSEEAIEDVFLDTTAEPEQPELPELPLPPEIKTAHDLGTAATLAMMERFKQLNIRAFPPGQTSIDDIVKDADELAKQLGKPVRIERERLAGLLRFAESVNGQGNFSAELYRLLPGSLNQLFPYYAAVIVNGDRKIIVAENPQFSNATYVFEEENADLYPWQEIIELDKQSIREGFGGRGLKHSHGKSIDYHYGRVTEEVISRLVRQ